MLEKLVFVLVILAGTLRLYCQSHHIVISKDQLTSLKNGGGGTRRVSSFEAIAAYAWRCSCKARKLEANQVKRLQVVVDIRDRVKPPLPSGYFGNAIVWTYVAAVAGEILSAPLPLIVRKIREAIARVDDEYVRSAIDALELKGDATEFFFSGEQITQNDLLVNSWSNLPMSSADFGWGKPAFMGRSGASTKSERRLSVASSSSKEELTPVRRREESLVGREARMWKSRSDGERIHEHIWVKE
ncbi:hypothetical protein Cni_G02873 [Canna indica]|uniref:Uncharacterized protein n=1 Tax=Canna indica TaxID=4628 RepID=A0AAQ3JQW2_9LILI|nr:hypothetical protein Cni_G02873 [Canna indica]